MTKHSKPNLEEKRVRPPDTLDYREVFSRCGLSFDRCFGSRSGYSRTNPGCIFIPNASIFTRDQVCVWRGDLDLASPEDVQSLIDVARLVNHKLYILPEQTHDRIPSNRKSWFVASTIVTIWRGRVAAGVNFRCLRGKFSEDRAVNRPAHPANITPDGIPPLEPGGVSLTVTVKADRNGHLFLSIPRALIRRFGARAGDTVTIRSRGLAVFYLRFYRRTVDGWLHLLVGGKTRFVRRRF